MYRSGAKNIGVIIEFRIQNMKSRNLTLVDTLKNVFLLSLMIFIFCPGYSRAQTVKVDVLHSFDGYRVGGSYPIALRLRISKPLYIHGPEKKTGLLFPTVLSFQERGGIQIKDIGFPAPEKKKFDYAPEPVEVFSGKLLVRMTLAVQENAPLGTQEITGALSYQACSSNACLPPEKIPIVLKLRTVPEKAVTKPLNRALFLSPGEGNSSGSAVTGGPLGSGVWLTLLGIFLGGLALNLTPCVYPLIPITVSYFGGRNQDRGGRPLLHGIAYLLGLAITNSALGVSAALSGKMLGSALQNPLALVFVSGVLVTLGLSFFGVWELRMPAALTRLAAKSYGGYTGTLFMGLTLGVVAAPCLGPFILGLITYVGQKGDPLLGFLYFFVLSVGLGLPLMALGIFSGQLDRLPFSGTWMIWVRKGMGWVLMGMAAYMISPLIPSGLGGIGLTAGVILAAGVHLGWLEKESVPSGRFLLFRRALTLVVIGGVSVYLLTADRTRETVHWIPYSEEAVSGAAKDRNPLLLDFYAEWCGPCKAMERKVFTDPEVVRLSRSFVNVRVDLTRRGPSQTEVLDRYGVRGVPTIIFVRSDGEEAKGLRIESYVGKSEVLARMKLLLKLSLSTRK